MKKLITTLALSVLAIASVAPTASANGLQGVFVDRNDLNSSQRAALERIAARYSYSAGGHRCQRYGQPTVWCHVNDKETISQIVAALRQAGIQATPQRVGRLR